MNERQRDKDGRERACRSQQNSPRFDQGAEIHREGSDEHQRHVEGGTDPSTFIEPEPLVARVIREAQRDHAAGQRDRSRSDDDAKNPQQRAFREVGRRNFCDGLRNLRRRRQA